jgi:hypothetical protein
MAAISANLTAARDGTVRGPRTVHWRTVVVLAVVLAYADGYWLVSLQGAVGAIGRTEHPFATWLRVSTVVLPVFAFAVLGALTLALRWFGPEPDRTRAVVPTALLVVASGTAVGLAAIVASSAFDYHLQSAHLQLIQGMSSMNGRCDSSCLAHQKADTLEVHVRGVLLVSRWVLLTNLVLVAWVTAMMGGRIRLTAPTRPQYAPADPEPLTGGRVTQVRRLLVGALMASAAIHVAVIPEHLTEWPAAGLFFNVLSAAELAIAGLLLAHVRRTVLLAAAAISLGPLVLWLYSRTAGMPFGPDPGVPESIGVPDCLACALEVASLLAAVSLLRSSQWLARRSPLSPHGQRLVVLALISVTTVGVAATGLSWFDAFGVSSGHSGAGMGH